MDYIIICLASFFVSILTLFSGFGLGTVLMPVFALFFPLPIAIAATAVVHLANNLFKVALVGKLANWNVVIRFGVPAIVASAIGAYLLGLVSNLPPIASYSIHNHPFPITYLGVAIGLIIIASSLFELIPQLSHLSFSSKWIPLGGILSGFFGGLSGNQGIFRSAFLIKAGLKKEEFIGTSVIVSTFVDIVRLLVYGWIAFFEKYTYALSTEMQGILIAASLTAFLGSYVGSQMIHQVTFRTIQLIVGLMLLILGTAIALGIA